MHISIFILYTPGNIKREKEGIKRIGVRKKGKGTDIYFKHNYSILRLLHNTSVKDFLNANFITAHSGI